jgi:hypothetical protein
VRRDHPAQLPIDVLHVVDDEDVVELARHAPRGRRVDGGLGGARRGRRGGGSRRGIVRRGERRPEHLRDLGREVGGLEGFQDVVGDSELHHRRDDRLLRLGGEHEDRRLVAARAHLGEHAGAIEDGHGHVEQHEIDGALFEMREALLAILGLVDLEAHLDELLGDDRSNRAAVVDGENPGHWLFLLHKVTR